MESEKHDQIMTKVTKLFADENLKIGEAISVWWSLGMFLFSHADKAHNTKAKVYEAMNMYISTVQKEDSEKKIINSSHK